MTRLRLSLVLVVVLFALFSPAWSQDDQNKDAHHPSANKTIWENIRDCPELSMLAKSLKYPEANATRELLDSCSDDGSTTMTLMAPSDGAIRKEIDRLNKLLSDSGYPSLEEIGKNMSENTRPIEGLAVQMDDQYGALNVFHIMGAAAQLEQIVSVTHCHIVTLSHHCLCPCVLFCSLTHSHVSFCVCVTGFC